MIESTPESTERKPRFCMGHEFNSRGRYPRRCKVTDILTTRNAAGQTVKIRYVAEHVFAGQLVVDRDVTETTIAIGS